MGHEPAEDPKMGISAVELTATVLRTLALPDVVTPRPRLAPELPLFGSQTHEGGKVLLSGQVDVIAFDEAGAIDAVVDWKSDVAPDAPSIGHYRQQIADYRKQTNLSGTGRRCDLSPRGCCSGSKRRLCRPGLPCRAAVAHAWLRSNLKVLRSFTDFEIDRSRSPVRSSGPQVCGAFIQHDRLDREACTLNQSGEIVRRDEAVEGMAPKRVHEEAVAVWLTIREILHPCKIRIAIERHKQASAVWL
ncbi:bll1660 [Bradyrhizobium diazoefficiens USDA 110]|uniref:Bll1660 protein n=3 Tax=Bradyrhizobium TaxID=374 RepID=Q89TW3_BRADU|nr:hypothetical protein AAV28_05215 [Bradyrhizobium diazoefficiens USDA 110]QBP20569.1 hypothetical protein Bdiaspc4_08415 [Bradyrhizobium diazoefficiens]BAC46925.1 bll1660 [Bradyrhizobium diazoefficiens USDA 110]